jgi:hypothetical protein
VALYASARKVGGDIKFANLGNHLAMLHQVAITDIDQWLCNYSACDQAYLLHFYRSSEKRDFRRLWVDTAPLIKAQPIPSFTPTRRTFRMDGIVI